MRVKQKLRYSIAIKNFNGIQETDDVATQFCMCGSFFFANVFNVSEMH